MIDQNTINNFQKSHFLAYIFLYAAHSDSHIDDEEVEVIQEELIHTNDPKLTNDECREILKDTIVVFEKHSGSERKTFIQENVTNYLSTQEEKSTALNAIENVIAADLEIDCAELETYKFLKGFF